MIKAANSKSCNKNPLKTIKDVELSAMKMINKKKDAQLLYYYYCIPCKCFHITRKKSNITDRITFKHLFD